MNPCSIGIHRKVSVSLEDHTHCGKCYRLPEDLSPRLAKEYPKGYCPHSLTVCTRPGCDWFECYGSHGKMTVIPDGCKSQAERMRKGGKDEVLGTGA